jgi:D-beta-D-heptose 7-phosphate kinase/D-beta-D-heptose 1-phosphate adenosyltransferase
LTLPELEKQVATWKFFSRKVVFTNGCFDILHAGHIASLTEAARHGDVLVIGVNADASIRGLKGENRPVNNEQSRALLLASLSMVDAVTIFDHPTPLNLICSIMPDVLVKGGDYKVEEIAGAKEVIAAGGEVVINPILPDYSTTSIIQRIQNGGR